ncbi:hypothetical protein GUJ93_ZPchr0008g11905 [Zizania palustris]|uniref:Uncharacterized protein n=1 Tax=Zizania palustris TaxID=103762 RepID=A0A8J5RKV9_ZIZPA|nr:hypothetical protein GUJ93_ZPchr0008g11905 [Zizania palustris]
MSSPSPTSPWHGCATPIPSDQIAEERSGDLQRSGSSSRLNLQLPEFVPLVATVVAASSLLSPVVRVFPAPPPSSPLCRDNTAMPLGEEADVETFQRHVAVTLGS